MEFLLLNCFLCVCFISILVWSFHRFICVLLSHHFKICLASEIKILFPGLKYLNFTDPITSISLSRFTILWELWFTWLMKVSDPCLCLGGRQCLVCSWFPFTLPCSNFFFFIFCTNEEFCYPIACCSKEAWLSCGMLFLALMHLLQSVSNVLVVLK